MRNLPVLETDFLLGLRKGDRKHQLCTEILGLAKTKKLTVCGSAFVEIGIGLRGSLARADVVETLRSLRALTALLPEIPLSSSIIVAGLNLERKLSVSNLFDCLHAATALSHDAAMVSDDRFYDRVPGLSRLSFSEFVRGSSN